MYVYIIFLVSVIFIKMIDKGKYASHGVFIKKISEDCLAKRQKASLAVINPIPSTKPRKK